jgi:hypothetical protein
VFWTYIETTETNRIVSKQTETTWNCLKKTKDDLYQTAAELFIFLWKEDKNKNKKSPEILFIISIFIIAEGEEY